MLQIEDASVATKLEALHQYLTTLGSVLVCYSGGVDSAFVLAAAHRALGDKAVGMTAVSPSLAAGELEDAARVAREIGAVHRLVESHEIDDPGYQANAVDRCFYCKSELYRIAAKKQREWGLEHVVNGTNVEDLGDYRPGLKAASEAGVKSPLVELGFDKAAVRAGARLLGLEVWDKPAAACLSSRIPFGTRVTAERLAQIGRFEAALKALGFRRVRVRFHPAGTGAEHAFARIELDVEEITRAAQPETREAIVRSGRDAGFAYVTLDLAGYRMGSHNEVIANRAEPRRALPVLG
ncbi:MAG: ATP-dependent sacrificial sulfur transferase LarE [Polyangiaceae bacterium]